MTHRTSFNLNAYVLLISGFTALFLLTGCISLKSKQIDDAHPMDVTPRVGNYYFLPRGLVQMDGEPVYVQNNMVDFKITVKVANVPDKEARYFLRHRINVFYDDAIVLKVNGKGLLESVNITTEDRTPAIIDKIADTIIDIGKIASSGNPLADVKSLQDENKPKAFHVQFDPLSPIQRGQAVAALEKAKVVLAFDDDLPNSRVMTDVKRIRALLSNRSSFNDPKVIELDGAAYRPPMIVGMSLSLSGGDVAAIKLAQVSVRVPDAGALAVMDTSRSFLIKKINNYTLVDGDLYQIDHTRPSQLLAAVSIPASIARKVSEAIPTIVAIQDKRAARVPPDLAAQKAQLDAETSVLNSKAALIKAQEALQPLPNPRGDTVQEVVSEVNAAKHREEEAQSKASEAKARAEEAQAKAEAAKRDLNKPPVQ